MIIGCVPPMASPSMNATAINSDTLSISGKMIIATPVANMPPISSGHSLRRCTIAGSTRRTRKIAAPKEPRISPIIDADRPSRVPWIGVTKVNKSQAIDSTALATNARRRPRMRNRSPTRLRSCPAADAGCAGNRIGRSSISAMPTAVLPPSSRKVSRWPIRSMAKPEIVGPRKPDVENASASRLKLRDRCSGVPSSPATWLTHICTSMKPLPATALTINSTSMRGNAAASSSAPSTRQAPISSGLRTPMRSMVRPQPTANTSGTAASSEISTPTVSGVACRCSASSDSVTRLPANARCRITVSSSTKRMVMLQPGLVVPTTPSPRPGR